MKFRIFNDSFKFSQKHLLLIMSENLKSSAQNDADQDDDYVANKNDDLVDVDEEQEEDDEYYEYNDDYPNPFYQKYDPNTNAIDSKAKKDTGSLLESESNAEDLIHNTPISAIAPKIFQQDDTQVEISSTPAFQCLEEVSEIFRQKKIKT